MPAAKVQKESRYLVMRDGVRIAIDVYLPQRVPAGGAPAVLRQTRYYRATEYRALLRLLGLGRFDLYRKTRQLFLTAGYAWIDVDARGSGASFGHRDCPLSPDEVRDGAEIVDWIVRQPWSSGRVGATGISYDGAAAELLLANQHPAVRAVAPLFSFYDAYTDVGFPGGIQSAWFTARWQDFNQALDAAEVHRALAMQVRLIAAANLPHPNTFTETLLRLADTRIAETILRRAMATLIRGPRPIDGGAGRELLMQALSNRDNFDVHHGASAVEFRDDSGVSERRPDDCIDIFSPHTYAECSPDVAVLSYSGWFDGGYCRAATRRFAERHCGHRELVMGPWGHGGVLEVSRDGSRRSSWPHERELLRFFDRHLRGRGEGPDAPVRYFTLVEDRWKSALSWPPPGVEARSHFLTSDGLRSETPVERGSKVVPNNSKGRGNRTRWNSLITGFGGVDHAGDNTADGACFRGEPLEDVLEVTGHPLLRLWVCAEDTDLQAFAYLQDEAPSGHISWVSEGQLLASRRSHQPGRGGIVLRSHRRADARPLTPGQPTELVLDLYPVSYLFRRGHRIRLQITTSDRSHFPPLQLRAPARVLWGAEFPSHIDLPVMA